MDFYWLYNFSNPALFAVICGTVVAFSLGGCLLFRNRFDRWFGIKESDNDVIGQFLSFTGIFYGITLGLIAVGVWDSFNQTQDKINAEAASIGALYRDVGQLPEPNRTRLLKNVRSYTEFIVDHEWGLQQQGIVPGGGNIKTTTIADSLYAVQPVDIRQQVILAETLSQFNAMLVARNLRLQGINDGLPPSMWFVIIIGTVLNIILTWLLVIKNPRLDIGVNLIVSLLLGSVLFFIVAMDNPFRGNLSVSSGPYAQLLVGLMR
jgi:Protein of unknown function (DUF4239)